MELSTSYPQVANISSSLDDGEVSMNVLKEVQVKRIAVKAELEISGSAPVTEIVHSLSQADWAKDHPQIDQIAFAAASQTNTITVQLIVPSDSYATAEEIAEKFLQSIDSYIERLPRVDMTAPVDVHEGSMLLMPA